MNNLNTLHKKKSALEISKPPSFRVFLDTPNRLLQVYIQGCRFERKCGRDKLASLGRPTIVGTRLDKTKQVHRLN